MNTVGTRLAFGTLAAWAIRSFIDNERLHTEPLKDFTAHGFSARRIDTSVGKMNLYEGGSGTPLLFLHGIGGGASSWTWSKVAPAFLDSHRVIVPDWIGWGESDHPARMVLFDDYVTALEALLNDIGEPVLVVAQGLSPGFVAAVAQRQPDRFLHMVMCCPAGGMDFGEDLFFPFQRNTLERIARSEPLNLIFYRLLFHRRFAITAWMRGQGYYEKVAVDRELTDGWLYSSRKQNAAYSALPFLSGALRFDFAPYMRDLTVPATMLWGGYETQVGLDRARRFAALNPSVPLIVIDRAKANFELELPAQMIHLLIRVFRTADARHSERAAQ